MPHRGSGGLVRAHPQSRLRPSIYSLELGNSRPIQTDAREGVCDARKIVAQAHKV